VDSTATLTVSPLAVLGSTASLDETAKRLRIIDATVACISSSGIRGTSVEAIASEAGLARATIYRTFAGGRDEILGAVVETEVARFFASLSVELAQAATLEDLCVKSVTGTAQRLSASAALAALLRESPELVTGLLAFDAMSDLLDLVSDFAWPYFGRWLAEDAARRAGELVARVAISYLMSPEPGLDLCDERSVRALIDRHVLAGVMALEGSNRGERGSACR